MRCIYRFVGFAGFLFFSLTFIGATANAANRAPSISGAPPTSVQTAYIYNFVPTATDGDGDKLTFAIRNKPSWAYFNPASGKLAGIPIAAGSHSNIIISVSDGKATVSMPAFTIKVVSGSNAVPTISGTPTTSVLANYAYSFQPIAKDANGDGLKFYINNKPSWTAFDSSSGRLYGTPGSANVGAYSNIGIYVTDGKAVVFLPTFSITVISANNPPQISGTPVTSVVAGGTYNFQPSATDADGNALTFAIANKPNWASFSTSTGRLSGTPTSAGTYSNIVVSVSDGKVSASVPAFTITVTSPNTAPKISGTPSPSVASGSAYSFRPSATDADGNILAFSIQNKPVWASFNTLTGALTGTPSSSHVGTYSNIGISVSDGKASAALPVFAIQVTSSNRAPVISGAPITTVKAGSSYSFRPTVTDADGDAITYSIANKPAWASFNTATGLLSGTPLAADVATYSAIVISASDGKTGVSLPAFSIAVTQIATGNVTLSWTAPTQNTDGTALTDLAGYRIFYGNNASSLTQTVNIDSAGISLYMVENLSSGTWYFAIKAVSSTGTESDFSTMVSKAL